MKILKQKKGIALAVTAIMMVWVFLVLTTMITYTLATSKKIELYEVLSDTKLQIKQISYDYVKKSDFKDYYLINKDYEELQTNILQNNNFVLDLTTTMKLVIKNNDNNILAWVELENDGVNNKLKSLKLNSQLL